MTQKRKERSEENESHPQREVFRQAGPCASHWTSCFSSGESTFTSQFRNSQTTTRSIQSWIHAKLRPLLRLGGQDSTILGTALCDSVGRGISDNRGHLVLNKYSYQPPRSRALFESSCGCTAESHDMFNPHYGQGRRKPLSTSVILQLWISLCLFICNTIAADKTAADYYVHSLPGQPAGPLLKMHAG